DEGATPKTEDSIDDTVITLPSGRSVDLPHVSLTALTETGFAFDRAPAFDRSDATAIGHDTVMHGLALGRDWIRPPDSHEKNNCGTKAVGDEDHGASSLRNLGSMDAADTHGHSTDADSNPGHLRALENVGGNPSSSSDADEHGAAPMHGAGAHDV